MATDILIMGLIISISIIFGLIGMVERKYGFLLLVSGVILLAFAAQLGSDPSLIVDHTSAGANVTYSLSGTEIFSLGVMGIVFMIVGGARSARLM